MIEEGYGNDGENSFTCGRLQIHEALQAIANIKRPLRFQLLKFNGCKIAPHLKKMNIQIKCNWFNHLHHVPHSVLYDLFAKIIQELHWMSVFDLLWLNALICFVWNGWLPAVNEWFELTHLSMLMQTRTNEDKKSPKVRKKAKILQAISPAIHCTVAAHPISTGIKRNVTWEIPRYLFFIRLNPIYCHRHLQLKTILKLIRLTEWIHLNWWCNRLMLKCMGIFYLQYPWIIHDS